MPEYYTIAEAAERLRVSRTTVWRWIREGRLPAYRAGSRVIRIEREDLEKELEPVKQGAEHAREDIWADYDPAQARARLRTLFGVLKGIDRDEFMKYLREARE